jgi:flagellar hook-basal body complex protein FliE
MAAELVNKQAAGMNTADEIEKPNFGQLVESIVNNTISDVNKAERLTAQSVTGEVSTEDLAIAVANAEISLKTLMSIRDKIITAYQEILRMPI